MMNRDKKLLVFDLDGTLLTDHKDIPQRTRETLKRAKEKGYALCYASGRCEEMMSVYQAAVGGCEYCISCNGAKTTDMLRHQIIDSHVFKREDVQKVLEYALVRQMDFMMYTTEAMYFPAYSEKMEQHVKKYEKLSETWGFPVKLNAAGLSRNDLPVEIPNVLKIVMYLRDEAEQKQYADFVEKQENLIGESTGYGLLGTFEKHVSKKYAVESLMKYMQITEQDVYVFGDYDNDLSMFSAAAHRIAVMNATEEVKKKATYITASNNDEGVAEYLEKVLQI